MGSAGRRGSRRGRALIQASYAGSNSGRKPVAVERSEFLVAVDGRVDVVLEHAEVGESVHVGLGAQLSGLGAGGGRLRVVARLDAVPQ